MAERPRMTPVQAFAALRAGQVRLIDIRRPDEVLLGRPEGAECRTVDELIEQAEDDSPAVPLALICGAGNRSCLGVDRLRSAGLDAIDVQGGLQAWRDAGLPVELPPSPLTATERDRYRRHLALPGFGEAGQLALRSSSVLLVGCGGLGSPAALYLAAAGIGRLTLVDDDRVERSNLQRQVLHDETRIGQLKVESARDRLSALNPEVRIDVHERRLDARLAGRLVPDHDLVLDGSDNFETRFVTNAACIESTRPLVYGAVERFSGQVGLFRPGIPGQACFRCLFPSLPESGEAPGCAEAGVLGVLPGVIGTMQALEAIKWLSAETREQVPTGWIGVFDGRSTSLRTLRVPRDPACPACGAPSGAGT